MTPEEKEKLKGDIKRLEWYKQLRTKMNGDVQWVFGELVNTDNLGKYFDTKVSVFGFLKVFSLFTE